jgi:hypothetical protein
MRAKPIAVSTLFITLALTGAGATAAEQPCKGLSEPACGAEAGCGWVNGYTRKDGREVAPYCRTKGKAAASAAAATVRQARPEG